MRICSSCTTNPHLQSWILARASGGTCSVCGAMADATSDLDAFVHYVDSVIRSRFSPSTADDEGEAAGSLISRVAGISLALARRVIAVRHDDEFDGPNFYDYGPLGPSEPFPGEYLPRWCDVTPS
jgi:hypothetical protein